MLKIKLLFISILLLVMTGCNGVTESLNSNFNSVTSDNAEVSKSDGTSSKNITDDGYVYVQFGDDIAITGYKGNSSKIEIPETIEGKNVISIENYSFKDCLFIEEAIIPETVTSIGYQAFEGTALLNNNSDDFVIIGNFLYMYKGMESSVTIPEDVLYISPNAFFENETVKEVTLPSNMSLVGKASFSSCFSLEKINFPEGITEIGSGAFSMCKSLKTVNLPSTLTVLGTACFSECESLEKITLSENTEVISDRVFQNCTCLKEINIPDSVQYIGAFAFLNCSSLKEIRIPDGITSILISSFNGCSNLESIKIPDSVKSIYMGAFTNCTNLLTIQIPSSVENIIDSEDDTLNNPFSGCDNLTIITPSDSIAYKYALEHDIKVKN